MEGVPLAATVKRRGTTGACHSLNLSTYSLASVRVSEKKIIKLLFVIFSHLQEASRLLLGKKKKGSQVMCGSMLFLRRGTGKRGWLCFRRRLRDSVRRRIFSCIAGSGAETQSFVYRKYWHDAKMIKCEVAGRNPVARNPRRIFNALITGTNDKQHLSVWLRAIRVCQRSNPAVITFERGQTMSDY